MIWHDPSIEGPVKKLEMYSGDLVWRASIAREKTLKLV